MPRVFITSGTSYTLPADFNPSNNTVECYGGGAPGFLFGTNSHRAGGGGAYAAVNNLNIGAGSTVNIGVGSLGSPNTYFNATSLANAVSNGVTISVGAQGGLLDQQGSAASSCGTVKYDGGFGGGGGGFGGGGGGGGCGGPNGPGAHGGNGGSNQYTGAGGGGANNGSIGENDQPTRAGAGGSGRSGSGGGSPKPSGNGGDAVAGTGGGGSGCNDGAGFRGGNGALDDVYGDGVHGPGGGGGGGAYPAYPGPGTNSSNGGAAGGFGGGGGGGGPYGLVGSQSDGLIVITYVSVPIGGTRSAPNGPILTLRAPYIVQARGLKQADSPPLRLDWFRQSADLLQRPYEKIIYKYTELTPREAPNPTPLYKPPWLPWPDLIRHPVVLDYRQQFPGRKPPDFFAILREGPDTVSSVTQTNSPINAALLEYDEVVATVHPVPDLGGPDDIIRRVKLLIPKGWFNDAALIRDAIIGGIADTAAWSYSMVTYAKKQTRVAWATNLWLDIISRDYFRFTLSRRVNESDDSFRARIQKELIRERVTRKGMVDALTDLTGKIPYVFEPWNTGDTGAWDVGNFAFDVGGGWGDTILPAQSFVNVVPPGAGIPGAPGWDVAALGWDAGGFWGDMNMIAGTITDQDVYDTINRTRPTGSIVWTQLFPPAGPTPLPVTHTRTPSFAPPGMIPSVVQPDPKRYNVAVMPDSV